MSGLENLLCLQLDAAGVPEPEREYKFALPRKWRFDLAWPDKKLYCEVEGGTYVYGRHSRPAGFESDCEKYGEAAIRGWRGVRVTGHMVEDGRALALVQRLLESAREWTETTETTAGWARIIGMEG